MKRFFLCLALGAGLLSCSESLTTRTSAGLAGTYDVALAGRYLFVTSSDRNELRVLDLEGSPRDFVRAPNPLEALSIPVLDRPSNLTRDMVYAVESLQRSDGTVFARRVVQDAGAPLVYARSFGSRQISVITADDPALFKERQRLVGKGLITAFAARGPVHTRIQRQTVDSNGTVTGYEVPNGGDVLDPARSSSVLYYAEQSGLNAKIYRLDMAQPDAPVALDLALAGSTVSALLVLPPPLDQPGQESLVIATHSTTGSGGETFRVEVNNTQVTRGVTYAFGAPVRALATHTLAETSPTDWFECSFDPEKRDTSGTPVPPDPLVTGQYVFGILDEGACGDQQSCSGVLAVDSVTGAHALDPSGLPMLPISVGTALPTGLTLAEGVDVNMPCQLRNEPTRTVPIVRRPLVGIVPASNGAITLFDAVRMRQFDLDPLAAGVTYSLVNSAGTTLTTDVPELTISVKEGVTRTDTYRLLYELGLPGLSSVARSEVPCPSGVPQGTCLELSVDTSQVELGDVVVLRNTAGTCKLTVDSTTREIDFKVLGKVASADGKTILSVETINPTALPADCQEMSSLVVRAKGTRPFVITSDSKGYLGRMGEGDMFEIAGTYYSHPVSVLDPAPKDIVIKTTRGVARGDQYIINASSHYLPYIFTPDVTSTTAGLATYRLPGTVVYSRVGGTDLAYIAYPSADGILQVSLETITDNAANTTGLVPFE